MGFNVENSQVNFNMNAILQSLDKQDGTADKKIKTSIWNAFAGEIGAERSSEDVDFATAENLIRKVFQKSPHITQKICNFFGWKTPDAAGNTVRYAEDLMENVAANPNQTEITEGEYTQAQSDAYGEGATKYKKATLGNGQYIIASYDKSGKLVKIAVSTDNAKQETINHEAYSNPENPAEVQFKNNEVTVAGENGNSPHATNDYDEYIFTADDYKFKQYKKLAEKIFGE